MRGKEKKRQENAGCHLWPGNHAEGKMDGRNLQITVFCTERITKRNTIRVVRRPGLMTTAKLSATHSNAHQTITNLRRLLHANRSTIRARNVDMPCSHLSLDCCCAIATHKDGWQDVYPEIACHIFQTIVMYSDIPMVRRRAAISGGVLLTYTLDTAQSTTVGCRHAFLRFPILLMNSLLGHLQQYPSDSSTTEARELHSP